MKKFLFTAVIVAGVFLVACTNNENSLDNNEEELINDNGSQMQVEVDILSDAEKELLKLLDDISTTVEVGTAGSSLKAVEPTSMLMNWAIGTQLVDEQIAKVVGNKLNSLTEEERETFIEQLALIDSTYKVLLSDSRDGLLETSGNSDKQYAWIDVLDENTTSFENMESLMNAAGLR